MFGLLTEHLNPLSNDIPLGRPTLNTANVVKSVIGVSCIPFGGILNDGTSLDAVALEGGDGGDESED